MGMVQSSFDVPDQSVHFFKFMQNEKCSMVGESPRGGSDAALVQHQHKKRRRLNLCWQHMSALATLTNVRAAALEALCLRLAADVGNSRGSWPEHA